MWILVMMDNVQQIFVLYYEHMLSSEDTNNMLNVTMPDLIQICCWELIL
jgi:hypothetical protein